MKTSKKYLLSALSGLLMVLAYPPFEFYFIGFVMFIPLMAVLIKDSKRNFWVYYLSMFIYQVGTNWWIAAIQEGKDPWLIASGVALAIGHPFFLIIPLMFLQFIRNRLFKENPERILWLYPLVWIGFEWLHSLTDFSYPWLSVGYTQIYNSSWVQMADLGGVWLVGLVMIFANVLMFRYLMSFRSGEIMGRKRLKYLIPLGLVILLPMIYGITQKRNYANEMLQAELPSINVALVQPNINPWDKWGQLTPIEQIKIHQSIIDSLIDIGNDIDLAIWSETVVTNVGYRLNVEHDFSILRNHARSRGYSLLTGFADIYFYDEDDEIPAIAKENPNKPGEYFDTYNAATLLSENDDENDLKNPQIYRKMKLTPFAERFPHAETFWFMRDLVKWGVGISGWQKGKVQSNMTLNDSVEVGTIICIESIYPDFVTNFSEKGADLLTVITNDAWYDFTPGPEQHYQIARMRAIENRRYLPRVANTGVSGLIGPDGSDIDRVEQYKRAGKVVTVPLIKEGLTLYSLLGGYIGFLSLLISTIFILITFFTKKKN